MYTYYVVMFSLLHISWTLYWEFESKKFSIVLLRYFEIWRKDRFGTSLICLRIYGILTISCRKWKCVILLQLWNFDTIFLHVQYRAIVREKNENLLRQAVVFSCPMDKESSLVRSPIWILQLSIQVEQIICKWSTHFKNIYLYINMT